MLSAYFGVDLGSRNFELIGCRKTAVVRTPILAMQGILYLELFQLFIEHYNNAC